MVTPARQTRTINQQVVTFLEGKRSLRVGGGECAHAASEALRNAGGEFFTTDLGGDHPGPGDYVWGSLVKLVSWSGHRWTDSQPLAKAIPGDILQYNTTRIKMGNVTSTTNHHTSIVAAVNPAGLPTLIYEQNSGNIRTLQKNAIDLKGLVSGWIRIYRPTPRIDKPGQYKFSMVNKMTTPQTVTVKCENQTVGSVQLSVVNTAASYLIQSVRSTSSTAQFKLVLSDGRSIQVVNAAAYELFN